MPDPSPPSVPVCPACKAPLDDEHNLRSGAVCPTLEPPPYRMAWCPVCRERVGIKPAVAFPMGQLAAWEHFDAHGCAHDGEKVRDRDHGFVTDDGQIVPAWEFLATDENAPTPESAS